MKFVAVTGLVGFLFFLAGQGLKVTNQRAAYAQEVNETSGKRSSEWPALAKRFRAENPTCAACGTRKGIQVHHIIPFHTDPRLELDESNLISLCKDGCHLKIGHGGSYKHFNPHVREDAAKALTNPAEYAEIAKEAKAHRRKNEPGG